MISFLNFDGSSVGGLPAGFVNTSTIPGHPGNFKVGTTGSVSSPNSLFDASGQAGGSAIWTGLLAADESIQFDQVVGPSGGVMNPLIRMSANGQTGYGAFLSWSTPKIDFVVINAGGQISTIASPAIPAYASGSRVTVKLEIQGTNLRFKSWLTGSAEPASWTATTTDSTYATAGYPGLSNGGGAVDNVYFGPAGSTYAGGFVAPVLSTGSAAWNSLQLTWTSASQSGGPSTSYQLMRSAHGANTFQAVSGATTSPAIDASVTPSTSYDYRVVATDGVNAPVNSNVVTLGTPVAPVATTYTLNGPAFGPPGQRSTPFTVSPNGVYTGTITITPAGAGLTTPIVLTFAGSAIPQSFTIDPPSTGTITLTPTNSGGLTNPGVSTYGSTSLSPFVAGSGQSLQVIASGVITAVQNGNDIQSLTLKGVPTGGSFELGFNGQTTSGIAALGGPPTYGYGLFTIPVTPGTAYLIATNLVLNATLDPNPNTLVQILDGNVLVATDVINQATGTPDYTFTDTSSAHPGNLISMKNLNGGAPITPTSATLKIYFTTAVTNYSVNTLADLVTLTNVATSAVSYYDNADSTVFTCPGLYNGIGGAGTYDNYAAGATNPVLGGVAFSASASSIQSALAALSTIGPGNVVVGGSNPFTITFTGTLAGVAQPLITCADPAVAIAHTAVGGVFPTITITPSGGSPGSPIPLKTTVWGSGVDINGSGTNIPPYADYLMLPFPASAPDHLYYQIFEGLTTQTGDWPNSNTSGYSGRASYNAESGSDSLIYMQGLPPATYQIALTWVADRPLASAVPVVITDNASGAVLASTTINQSIAPGSGSGDFALSGQSWRVVGSVTTTAPSTGFNFKMTNPGGSIALDTVLVSRTSANLSVQVKPTDTVLFSTPAGFITTASGPAPAFSAVVPNLSGGTSFAPGGLGAFSTLAKTMRVGQNTTPDNYSTPIIFSDLIGRIQFPMDNALASDTNGYPTLLSASTSPFNPVVLHSSDEYGLSKGLMVAPSGLWTFQWTGPDSIEPGLSSSPWTEVLEYQNLTGPIKQRVFNIQASGLNFSPSITLGLTAASSPDGNGHYVFASNNMHIYPPNPIDPTGMTPWGILGTTTPPRYHPNYLAQYGPCSAIRFLGFLGTNGNQQGEITDFRQPGMLYGPTRTINATVTSITAYTGTALLDPLSYGSVIEVTTSAPHQAFDGLPMTLRFAGTISFSDGTTLAGGAYQSVVAVKSATVIQIAVPATNGVTMTNTITGGTLYAEVGSPQSVADCLDLCNLKNADCWLQAPVTASTACLTALANYFAANLNPGLKVYGEFGNECWNYDFPTWTWCRNLSYRQTYTPGTGNDEQLGHILRGQLWHNALITAFTNAGRASDVVRVIGTQAANPGVTSDIVAICQAHSVAFEILAPAGYFDPWDYSGIEASFQNVFDLMTPYGTPSTMADITGGQAIDWYELMVVKNGTPNAQVAVHKAILNANGFSRVGIALYEAGTDVMTPAGSTVNTPFRSHVVLRHPRAYWSTLAMLQSYQDAGCELYMKFFINGSNLLLSFPNPTIYEWRTYDGWNEQPGTGNPAVDVINATYPEQLDQIVSEVGGAINTWNSLVPTATRPITAKAASRLPGSSGTKHQGTSASTVGGRRH